MRELAEILPKFPPSQPYQVAKIVNSVGPSLELLYGDQFAIEEQHAPSARDVACLYRRTDVLSHYVEARDAEKTASVISQMLAGFPSLRRDVTEAKMMVSAYLSVLADVPPWAVEKACLSYLRKPTPFAPAPGEILESAMEECRQIETELAQIRRVTGAKLCLPVPEGQRERVSRMMRDLAVSMASNSLRRSRSWHQSNAPTTKDGLPDYTSLPPIGVSAEALQRLASKSASTAATG
jgi:hypothetical protein